MAQIRFVPDSTNPDLRDAAQPTSRKASKALKAANDAPETRGIAKPVCLTCGASDDCDCERSKQ
jgi:hypothetical protein